MQFEKYEQMNQEGSWHKYLLQRTNDLLEQVEKLKAIETGGEPKLQIDVSMAIMALHEALKTLI